MHNFADNCFIIQQIVNEKIFVARKTVVVQRLARFRTNLCNLRGFLTIYGHRASLLNNKYVYEILNLG